MCSAPRLLFRELQGYMLSGQILVTDFGSKLAGPGLTFVDKFCLLIFH